MNIEDLQLIVETIYQHNPSAYKRGGDVEFSYKSDATSERDQ